MRLFSASRVFMIMTCVLLSGSLGAEQNIEPQAPFSWSTGPDLPIALQEIYPAVFNKRIFVGGGFTPSDLPSFSDLGPTTDVFLLHPAHARWTKAPTLPAARHHLGMVSNQHFLYAIGGFTGARDNAWQIQSSVFRLDGNMQAWRNAPSLPIPLAESVYASVGKNIHVIGGKTTSRGSGKNIDTDAHYVLVNNAYWRKVKSASVARNSAASAVIGHKIFVIGGRTSGKEGVNLSHAEVYNTKTDSWSPIAPLPVASAGLSASVLDGKIIVSGGEVFGPNGDWQAGKALDHVWAYDPQTDLWQALPNLPQPRHGHGSVSFNEQLHIIGGAAKVGPQETLSSTMTLSLHESE
ncbi:kelch repeat-containing protein [Pseudoalteromonas sp. OOF1S-7]|uniref:Kelch repeat-containing protein n=1 Tax=Pseudoalteromonas sp. OOF1S-7 TaxID=2917757 RepID=UPI001EF55AE0|nr:kelch repeat-containing protein [Pseudoalteromonas sp. OOF1S-7]MCG7536577.1 hypothetical protein [Pseudoalteromonas sp. OOF1S-7]